MRTALVLVRERVVAQRQPQHEQPFVREIGLDFAYCHQRDGCVSRHACACSAVAISFFARVRLQRYGTDGKPAGKPGLTEAGAISVEDRAQQIVAALRGRNRELMIASQAKMNLWLKLLAPRRVDNMAHAVLKKEAVVPLAVARVIAGGPSTANRAFRTRSGVIATLLSCVRLV
jgi:hypothetical protein